MIDSEFIPDATERYIDMAELGDRWGCHPKTAAKRFKDFGGAKLLIGGSVRYPISQIIAIERESLSRFSRVTAQPKHFVEARERRQKERMERHARRRKQAVGEPA